MPGVWIHKDTSWTRKFSPLWSMEVNNIGSGCIGVLTYRDQIVIHASALTVAMCEKEIENRTRIYFAALLVDIDSTS
jgi:hypothetical protein